MSKEFDAEAFERDVRAGDNPNKLAKAYGITWAAAKAKRAEILGAEPETTQDPEGGEEQPAAYEITINVPTDGIDDLLRGLPPAELLEAVLSSVPVNKATVLQLAMQRRMDRLFEQAAPALSVPTLELVQGVAHG